MILPIISCIILSHDHCQKLSSRREKYIDCLVARQHWHGFRVVQVTVARPAQAGLSGRFGAEQLESQHPAGGSESPNLNLNSRSPVSTAQLGSDNPLPLIFKINLPLRLSFILNQTAIKNISHPCHFGRSSLTTRNRTKDTLISDAILQSDALLCQLSYGEPRMRCVDSQCFGTYLHYVIDLFMGQQRENWKTWKSNFQQCINCMFLWNLPPFNFAFYVQSRKNGKGRIDPFC